MTFVWQMESSAQQGRRHVHRSVHLRQNYVLTPSAYEGWYAFPEYGGTAILSPTPDLSPAWTNVNGRPVMVRPVRVWTGNQPVIYRPVLNYNNFPRIYRPYRDTTGQVGPYPVPRNPYGYGWGFGGYAPFVHAYTPGYGWSVYRYDIWSYR